MILHNRPCDAGSIRFLPHNGHRPLARTNGRACVNSHAVYLYPAYSNIAVNQILCNLWYTAKHIFSLGTKNNVQLSSSNRYLGSNPYLTTLDDGTPIANVNIATTKTWNDKAGVRQERTDWHRLFFVGKQATLAGEYLAKGSKIFATGEMRINEVHRQE